MTFPTIEIACNNLRTVHEAFIECVKQCSDQAKAKAKISLMFAINLIFDLLHLFCDLFRFRYSFRLV